MADTRWPGFYYLRFVDRLPEGKPGAFAPAEADRVLVINLDLRESNLARISEPELKSLLPAAGLEVVPAGAGFSRVSADQVRRRELAHTLLICLVLAAAAELIFLRKG